MPDPNLPPARKASHGNKTIEVRIRFFTDAIADGEDMIIPKHCWDQGIVVMDTNTDHGIAAQNPKNFNSILELQIALAKLLAENEIKLHPGNKLKKIIH